LFVVVVNPAARDDGSVESGDGRLGKETGKEVANDAADSV